MIVRIGMNLLSLSASPRGARSCCRASDACVERVVNENIAVDAVESFTFRAFKKMFVGVVEVTLTCEAVTGLLLVENFDKVGDGKQMMIGASEMWCKHKRQSADNALDWELAILRLALWTEVTGCRQLARLG